MAFTAWLQRLLAPREDEHGPSSRGGPSSPGDTGRTRPRSSGSNGDSGTPLAPPDAMTALRDLASLLAFDARRQEKERGENRRRETSAILLALGNLFREKGDIVQAVRVRELLLDQPGLPSATRAEACYELGRDYRKAGFLDRALTAFKDGRKLGYDEKAVSEELLQLYADSGDFSAAAREAATLGLAHAEAHFHVRHAEELAGTGRDDDAVGLLRKALTVYPGSPEARLAKASIYLSGGNAVRALKELEEGLAKGVPSGRLILLEGIYAFINGPSAPGLAATAVKDLGRGLDSLLTPYDDDVTMCYYGGLFLQHAGAESQAEQWFTKALVLDPDFWAARLAILDLCADREDLPPLLAAQIAFFTEQGGKSKRFTCPPCGMRRDSIFSQCPRCRAWHSASFRMRLT